MRHPSDKRQATRMLLPHTPRGRWSVRLATGSVVLIALFFLLVVSGQRGGETFFSNLWLSGTILPAAGLAVASGAVGAIAVIKDSERSLTVFVAIAFGSIVLLFIVGELAFPH